MSDTIREQIILAILAKVANIQITAGYNTDCGDNVLRAIPLTDPDNLPYISVWPEVEESSKVYGKTVCVMPVKIQTVMEYGSSNPSVIGEGMLGDIIENIQGAEYTLPYTTGSTEIEVGDSVVGATSAAIGYVCGVTLATGTWAGGDAAGTISLRRLTGTFVAENLKVSGSVVAATTGVITAVGAITSTTGDLAESIQYVSGGIENYPEAGTVTIETIITFNIKYNITTGDPYNN